MIYFVPVLADARDFLLIIQFNSKAVEEFQTQIRGVCSTQLLEINTRIKQGFLICQTGKIFASGKKLQWCVIEFLHLLHKPYVNEVTLTEHNLY